MTRFPLLLSIALLAACELTPKSSSNNGRIVSARFLTQKYSQSRLAVWNVRASAAGRDCDVLLVDTSVIMEDSMVEALHYGGGSYNVIENGGVERFCRARSFRGVAYRDSTARIWAYDGVTADEVQRLKRCD
jgi:hypothetical protein